MNGSFHQNCDASLEGVPLDEDESMGLRACVILGWKGL